MDYIARCTGFWQERLRMIDNFGQEYLQEHPDAYGRIDFNFMESIRPFSQSDITSWTDLLCMENKAVNDELAHAIIRDYSAYNFLHGDCNIFAQHLNEKYGYQVGALFECNQMREDDLNLIHMFCIQQQDGQTVYIDVRGKCDDFLTFMKEFYDSGHWSGDNETSMYVTYDMVPEKYQTSSEDIWRLKAAACIDKTKNYYNPAAH